MVCTTLTITEGLKVTEVDIVNEDDKTRTGFAMGRKVIIFVYTNKTADGTIEVKDNGTLIYTIYAKKDATPSGFYYDWLTSGTHNVCAEVV